MAKHLPSYPPWHERDVARRGTDFSHFQRTAPSELQDLRLLNQDPDADYLYTISPVVVPLVGVDELTRLEAAYRLGAGATANDGNGTENSAQLLDEES